MSQEPAIAEQLENEARAFFHRFHEMTLDGVVCEEEQDESLDRLDVIQVMAEQVNSCQITGILLMRRGPETRRAKSGVQKIAKEWVEPLDAA